MSETVDVGRPRIRRWLHWAAIPAAALSLTLVACEDEEEPVAEDDGVVEEEDDALGEEEDELAEEDDEVLDEEEDEGGEIGELEVGTQAEVVGNVDDVQSRRLFTLSGDEGLFGGEDVLVVKPAGVAIDTVTFLQEGARAEVTGLVAEVVVADIEAELGEDLDTDEEGFIEGFEGSNAIIADRVQIISDEDADPSVGLDEAEIGQQAIIQGNLGEVVSDRLITVEDEGFLDLFGGESTLVVVPPDVQFDRAELDAFLAEDPEGTVEVLGTVFGAVVADVEGETGVDFDETEEAEFQEREGEKILVAQEIVLITGNEDEAAQ